MKHVSTWHLILGGWLVVVPLILGGELFNQTHVTNDAVAGLLGCTAMVIFDLLLAARQRDRRTTRG